jgi:quinol monooxygenase YgiN
MLQHVVMWKVKDSALGMDKAALAQELKKRLKSLVGQVPSIRSFEIGVNELPGDTASDAVLVSSFDDMAGLEAYMKHPKHQEVVDFLKQIVAERRAVDYNG